jgi:ABC-type Na+ efflux pump permease subunit
VFKQLFSAIRDISEISLRRVWALAALTAREAIRRKALLVFGLFALLFMFGSWFLSGGGEKADIQIQRHVVFVFTVITWLVLPVVLMLACWGIPEDIKARSMHTVVTKPVRRVEIVLGRMLGFGMITTLVVAVMAIAARLQSADLRQAVLPRPAGQSSFERHQRRRRLDVPLLYRGVDEGGGHLGLRPLKRSLGHAPSAGQRRFRTARIASPNRL